eukprot:TRINITY_DN22104_c0_g1_i1.p1 TRINITY_DN22104_c0_g1~~TRINITY_DN22104_c0_g1_i1.p1  ORF type:complete len:780 (+),score=216.76 TRINITY_DN22104_c0_g1_i1:94-2340(+)
MADTVSNILVWECQRFVVIKGWTDPHLPMDYPAWCDAEGGKRPKKSDIPCPEGKRWATEWTLDRSKGDAEGWQYAVDFRLWQWNKKKRPVDFVRRRCWVRQAVPLHWDEKESEATEDAPGSERESSRSPDPRTRQRSTLSVPGSGSVPTDGGGEPGSAEWQPDGDAADCAICQKSFTLLLRKHHCRKCGRCVCDNCSPHRESLPGHVAPQRVCTECETVGASKQNTGAMARLRDAKSRLVAGGIAFHRNQKGDILVRGSSVEEIDGGSPKRPACAVLTLRVREGRAIAPGFTRESLVQGIPNPYVLARCGGAEMRTAIKAQTAAPQWGEAEASFSVKVVDPCGTLWLYVYDASANTVMRQDAFIGRTAVPLRWLAQQPGKARKGLWLCLLPAPPKGKKQEVGASADSGLENESGSGPPPTALFRGASPVSEELGMRLPKRPLGVICVDVQLQPMKPDKFGLVDPALFTAPIPAASGGSEQSNDDPFDIELMQDNAARLSARIGPPTVLTELWALPLPFRLGGLPLWALVCYRAPAGAAPLLVVLVLIINGILSGKATRARIRESIVLFEDHNPYSEPSLRFKLRHKILPALKAVQSLQNPIGRVATAVARVQALLTWDDPGVTAVCAAALLAAALAAGVLLELALLLPLRIYIFLAGAAMVVAGPGPKRAQEAKASEAEQPQRVLPPLAESVLGFCRRAPDDRELQHRHICELLIVDPSDVPQSAAQDRPDRLTRLDPAAPLWTREDS